jgi:hypothetical protein
MTSTELCPPDGSYADMSKHPSGACLLPCWGGPMNLRGKHMPGVRCSGGSINSLNRRADHRDTNFRFQIWPAALCDGGLTRQEADPCAAVTSGGLHTMCFC